MRFDPLPGGGGGGGRLFNSQCSVELDTVEASRV
jgi:hypothetical protein